jgi:hypothetical protein
MSRWQTTRFLGHPAVMLFGIMAAYVLVVRLANTPTRKGPVTAVRKPWDYDVRVHTETWNGEHLFWGKKPDAAFGRWTIVTERGKQWFEENAAERVQFKELPVK